MFKITKKQEIIDDVTSEVKYYLAINKGHVSTVFDLEMSHEELLDLYNQLKKIIEK